MNGKKSIALGFLVVSVAAVSAPAIVNADESEAFIADMAAESGRMIRQQGQAALNTIELDFDGQVQYELRQAQIQDMLEIHKRYELAQWLKTMQPAAEIACSYMPADTRAGAWVTRFMPALILPLFDMPQVGTQIQQILNSITP